MATHQDFERSNAVVPTLLNAMNRGGKYNHPREFFGGFVSDPDALVEERESYRYREANENGTSRHPHSSRSANIGSTLVARRAGIQQASSVTDINSNTTTA